MPHAIDIEGNEENRGGFKGGNRPDVEMQPGKKNADLVATINGVSAKIMANVAPTDPMRLEEVPGAVQEKRRRLPLQPSRENSSCRTWRTQEDQKVFL